MSLDHETCLRIRRLLLSRCGRGGAAAVRVRLAPHTGCPPEAWLGLGLGLGFGLGLGLGLGLPVLPTQGPPPSECSRGSSPRGGKWTDRSSGSSLPELESPLLPSFPAPAAAPVAASAPVPAAAGAPSWSAAGSIGSAPLVDRSDAIEGASPVSKGTRRATPSASTKARRTWRGVGVGSGLGLGLESESGLRASVGVRWSGQGQNQ